MLDLHYMLLLCCVGHLCGVCIGDDVDHTITANDFAQFKRELRAEFMSELRKEVQNEVRNVLPDIVKQELKTVLQGANEGQGEENIADRGSGKHADDKQSIVDLVKETVKSEIGVGICDKLIQELTENIPSSDVKEANSSRQSSNQLNTLIGVLNTAKRNRVDTDDAVNNLAPRQTGVNQVAFSVYLDHIMDHVSHLTTLKFNQIQLNEGNVYNVHTGTFTAPVSGVYLFHFEFLGWSKTTELRLVVDSDIVATAITDHTGDVNYMVKAGTMTLVRVNSGQSVWVQTYAKDDANVISSDGDKSSSFFGVLMY